MYLWNVDKLVEDFKSGEVSQKEEFKYILLFTVVGIIITDPFVYIGSSYNIYDFVSTILLLAVSAWGIYYCYKINSAGDNKDFIVRVMCIGLPVVIRVLVILIPIMILVGFFEAMFSGGLTADKSNIDNYETTVYSAFSMVIATIVYYIYLAKKIKAVST